MGLLNKIFGGKSKKTLPMRDFIEVLVMVAVDLPNIKRILESTGLPLDVQRNLRDEVIYLQIFSIEGALNNKLDDKRKSMVMDVFYDAVLGCFDEIEARNVKDLNLRGTVASGLDRTMPAYYEAVKSSTSDDDMFRSVGKAFALMAGYPSDPLITNIGAGIFYNSIKAVHSLWEDYDIKV